MNLCSYCTCLINPLEESCLMKRNLIFVLLGEVFLFRQSKYLVMVNLYLLYYIDPRLTCNTLLSKQSFQYKF